MRRRLLQYLCCPSCGEGELSLKQDSPSTAEDEESEIEAGSLVCPGCSSSYPIVRGIPRMFPEAGRYFETADEGKPAPTGNSNDSELASAVELTVTQYSAYQAEMYAPMAEQLENAKILQARTGLTAEDYEGKACLDAGCGVGRMTRVAAQSGASLAVGFDAGFSVDQAKRMTPPELDNVEWVQGDIQRAPFGEGVFDRIFSIGVLHHTTNPQAGFQRLAKSVSQSGSLSVYLYTHGYLPWNKLRSINPALGRLRYALVTEPFRRLVVRFPDSWRKCFCTLLWHRRRLIEAVRSVPGIGSFSAKVIEFLTPPDVYKPLEDAESNIARNFDMYSTPYNYSHDFTEVIDWYEQEKRFRSVDVTPYRLSMTGFSGATRTGDEPMQIAYRPSRSIQGLESSGVEISKPNN